MADSETEKSTPANDQQIDTIASDEPTQEQPQNAVNNQDNNQQQPAGEPFWKKMLIQMFFFWLISNLFRGGSKSDSTSTTGGPAVIAGNNLFQPHQQIDLYVYLSEEETFSDFDNSSSLIWKEKGLTYGNWYDGEFGDGTRVFQTDIPISETVQNNGSLFIHVYVTKKGRSPDPKSPKYHKMAVLYQSKMLNIYKKQRLHKTANLLTGESDVAPGAKMAIEVDVKADIVSYWHPNLTVNLLDDHTPWQPGSVPPPLDEFIIFDNKTGNYFPVLYLNNYWNLVSDYMPINDTTKTLELHLTYAPISLFRWQMYESQRMRNKWFNVLGEEDTQSDDEQDSLKRALVETNPYLLGITFVITIVHSIFEFLAFKNDIQFWKSRKSLEGLSVRSIFFNVFQSLIVLLYVLDNETNTVVKVSCFIGLGIECWKITKVVDVKFSSENRILGIFPRIWFADKSTYTESETSRYDKLAFKYLSWALFPLLFGYAIYSLLYQEHKSWYSFVLGMIYGFLLTFGFIMMTPQLFINYKMKSVAHLPWRMMTYKALNTFIDDIFAFVIKMPTLYRIGCFRDDIIFFIYLYQKWIYPIDLKRINEFGVTGEELTGKVTPIEETSPQNGNAITANGEVTSDKKKD